MSVENILVWDNECTHGGILDIKYLNDVANFKNVTLANNRFSSAHNGAFTISPRGDE